MLTAPDLNAPARLHYDSEQNPPDEGIDWDDAKEFPTLREALHWTFTAETPAGKQPFIRSSSGAVLKPKELETLWASLQGP